MMMQTFITFWMHPTKRKDSPLPCQRQKTYLPTKKILAPVSITLILSLLICSFPKSLYVSNVFIHLITFSMLFLKPLISGVGGSTDLLYIHSVLFYPT